MWAPFMRWPSAPTRGCCIRLAPTAHCGAGTWLGRGEGGPAPDGPLAETRAEVVVMGGPRVWLLALAAFAGAPACAAEPDDSDQLTARIDHYIVAGWARAGVRPSVPADDATFLRRVSLDIAGRIPSVS